MTKRAQDNLLRAFFYCFKSFINIRKKVLHIGLLGIMITTDLYFFVSFKGIRFRP